MDCIPNNQNACAFRIIARAENEEKVTEKLSSVFPYINEVDKKIVLERLKRGYIDSHHEYTDVEIEEVYCFRATWRGDVKIILREFPRVLKKQETRNRWFYQGKCKNTTVYRFNLKNDEEIRRVCEKIYLEKIDPLPKEEQGKFDVVFTKLLINEYLTGHVPNFPKEGEENE